MRKALQSESTRTPIGSRRRGRPPKQVSSAVGELADRFEKFRREHLRGTRFPDDLRAATLRALRKGVSVYELHRACGVSYGQIAAWKARHVGGRVVSTESQQNHEEPDVRVFSVVDEPPIRRAESLIGEQELELRLGSWSVRVRLSDPTAGRG